MFNCKKEPVEESKIKVPFTKTVTPPEHILRFNRENLKEILTEYARQNGVTVPYDASIYIWDYDEGGEVQLCWKGY